MSKECFPGEFLCLGKTGSIALYYTIPRPPEIRYSISGQGIEQSVIGGTHYTIQYQEQNLEYIEYSVPFIRTQYFTSPNWTGTIRVQYYGKAWTGSGQKVDYAPFIGTVNPNRQITVERIPYSERFPGSQGTFGRADFLRISGTTPNFYDQFSQFDSSYTSKLRFYRFTPGWNLTIFDCKNNQLFQQIFPAQPIITTVQSYWDVKDEKKIIVSAKEKSKFSLLDPYTSYINVETYQTLEGVKCSRAELGWLGVTGAIIPPQTKIDVCSHPCSDIHPKICFDCDGDPENKCPPETCVKCLNSEGKICCYDENGSVLKIVSTEDETPDC